GKQISGMSKVSLEGIITEDDKRPHWENKTQYLLSCIGFAVGFGNVWRFPYLCHIYGGGAFLIPYVIALMFEGIPIFHLELAIGQFLRKGSIGVWSHISPYLGGIGRLWLIFGIARIMIIAWVLWYLGNSFKEPLPWSICPNDANLIKECDHSSESNYFWYRYTLNTSMDITQTGPVLWWLVVSLARTESTGKAIYISISFLYITLTAFLIYALTLPGAIQGLFYLFTPDAILKNPHMWLDAATQSFFFLSLAFGGHIASSSYNPQKNDCEKDSVIIATVDCLTSTGETQKVRISCKSSFLQSAPSRVSGLKLKKCDLQHFLDKSASGPGLAFIVFTDVVTRMPGTQIWSILFFLMLFCLGLSSMMFGLIQGILTPFIEIPHVSKYLSKEVSCGTICFTSFFYWIEVFDSYGGSIPLLIISLFELYGIVYVYGLKRCCDNVEWMTGRPVHFYWKASWQFISPLLMLSILLSYLASPVYSYHSVLILCNVMFISQEEFPLKESKFYPHSVLFIGLTMHIYSNWSHLLF
uniref:Transporter n=1 Tax=Naja naja TaxID=35670 RepID=A0A8C6VAU5_NAJNA